MRLVVNGESRELPEGMTAAGLLAQLQIIPERVVVEVNLSILKRAQLAQTPLKDGDQVEIVQFVGGGSDFSHQTSDVSIPRLLRSVVWGLKSEV